MMVITNIVWSSIILLIHDNNIETAGVVIGFMDAPYQATENEGFVAVTFGVISGGLEREVAVVLSFLDGTAVGESLMFHM
jgi:hypothetical protein